jgi:hypothetical protein
MNEQRYKTLKAGDERRRGDEVRHVDISRRGIPCEGLLKASEFYHSSSYLSNLQTGEPILGSWEPVQLLRRKILASDLMVAEFRRPLPF